MLDFIKRICIALALAGFLGLLFITTNTAYAEGETLSNSIDSFIWPTVGEITDGFGTRDGSHHGIDIAAPEGTPVVSIADGVVSRSYYSDSYGHVIFVEHDNGLETVYAHLHKRKVEEEQRVVEGQLIGTVGNTGRSFGNHLHFEVHAGNWNVEKSESIDPMLVLSSEPEYMYAALGEASPYGQDWKQRQSLTTLAEREIPPALRNYEFVLKETSVSSRSTSVLDYHVQEGDTLWSIARAHRVSPEQLVSWNDLSNKHLIITGATLTIYPPEESRQIHIVEKGDTLTAIATSYEVSVDTLMERNNLGSDFIRQGQLLYVNN